MPIFPNLQLLEKYKIKTKFSKNTKAWDHVAEVVKNDFFGKYSREKYNILTVKAKNEGALEELNQNSQFFL